jgi:Na+/melibiose symporter-like transporter
MTAATLLRDVSSNEEQSSRAALVEALRVRRNAKLGLAVGVLFAGAVFVVFVALPSGTTRSSAYYGALAFVLALTVAGLVTAVLVAVRAYKLTREL